MLNFAMARGTSAKSLRDSVQAFDPKAGWNVQETDHGAYAVTGAPFAQEAGWLVAGDPQGDPWGVPGHPLPVDDLAADFALYGAAALQLGSGPFVAADLKGGLVLRALNGIVPVFAAGRESWAAGTCERLVSTLISAPPKLVSPGCGVSVAGGMNAPGEPFVRERLPGPQWRRFEREVASRVTHLGKLRSSTIHPGTPASRRWAKDVWTLPDSRQAVFLPRLSALERHADSFQGYLEVRHAILPELWRLVGVSGATLFAPAFERPALDIAATIAP